MQESTRINTGVYSAVLCISLFFHSCNIPKSCKNFEMLSLQYHINAVGVFSVRITMNHNWWKITLLSWLSRKRWYMQFIWSMEEKFVKAVMKKWLCITGWCVGSKRNLKKIGLFGYRKKGIQWVNFLISSRRCSRRIFDMKKI